MDKAYVLLPGNSGGLHQGGADVCLISSDICSVHGEWKEGARHGAGIIGTG